jgi:uncharacterized protein (TIGR02246 family)
MNRLIAAIIFGLCVSNLACVWSAEEGKPNPIGSNELAAVRQAIDKGNGQWIEAWDKADPAMIAGLFAEDGILLARNGNFFKGPKQILERQKALMEEAGKGVKATVTTVDLWLDGGTAYETGRYSYTYVDKGKPVNLEGRYVTVWKHQSDGSWKIIVDMGVPQK